MNQSSLVQAQISKLRQDVSTITDHLSRVDFLEETVVTHSNQLIHGTLEIVPNDEEGHRPTLVADKMMYAQDMECENLQVAKSAHISELSVDKIFSSGTNIMGITGCRGPPGYATNTGAVGPTGPVGNFDYSYYCSSGLCLVGTPTGLGFADDIYCSRISFHGPTLSIDEDNNFVMDGCNEFHYPPCLVQKDCAILPRIDPKAAYLVEWENKWCHQLEKGDELSFRFLVDDRWVKGTPIQIVVHYYTTQPTSLELHLLGETTMLSLQPSDGCQSTMSIPLSVGNDRVFQGTFSNPSENTLFIIHVSSQFSTYRCGTKT